MKQDISSAECTHAPAWLAHGAGKFIDEKGLIYIFEATSAPPRAGTTGSEFSHEKWWFSIVMLVYQRVYDTHGIH